MKVLVIGDVIIDRYLVLESTGTTTDSKAPKANVVKELLVPGGAAWAAVAACEMGAEVTLASVVGCGPNRVDLGEAVLRRGVSLEFVESAGYLICEKQRIVLNGNELVRIDVEEPGPVTEGAFTLLYDKVRKLSKHFDSVLVCDYQKGVFFDKYMTNELIRSLKPIRRVVHVNGKNPELSWYHGASSLQINEAEWAVSDKNWSTHRFMTSGSQGASYGIWPKFWQGIPNPSVKIVDTCGAGDVFAAAVVVEATYSTDVLVKAIRAATEHCSRPRWK